MLAHPGRVRDAGGNKSRSVRCEGAGNSRREGPASNGPGSEKPPDDRRDGTATGLQATFLAGSGQPGAGVDARRHALANDVHPLVSPVPRPTPDVAGNDHD